MNSEEPSKKNGLSRTDSLHLKRERRRHGWSQEELAELIGVTPLTIRRWEAGNSFPRPYYRQMLVKLFEDSIHSFHFSQLADISRSGEAIPPHVSRLLIAYRRRAGLTQSQLATVVDLSSHYISMLERGQRRPSYRVAQTLAYVLNLSEQDCDQLFSHAAPRDLYVELGFEPLTANQKKDFSQEEAYRILKDVEQLLDQGIFVEAYKISNLLVYNLNRQFTNGEIHLLIPLIHAEYLAGHSTSIAGNAPEIALNLFQKMERSIYFLQERDPLRETYLCIARTYRGEMLRRLGDIPGAIDAIASAPQGPDVDILVKGNRVQLLGRAYAACGDGESAVSQLNRARELASLASKEERDRDAIYVCFNLCSVYEEYARFYMDRDNIGKGLQFIELAEKDVSQESIPARWRIPVLLTKAEMLICKAHINAFKRAKDPQRDDFGRGVELVKQAITMAQEAGHVRQLARARLLVGKLNKLVEQVAETANNLQEMLARITHT